MKRNIDRLPIAEGGHEEQREKKENFGFHNSDDTSLSLLGCQTITKTLVHHHHFSLSH